MELAYKKEIRTAGKPAGQTSKTKYMCVKLVSVVIYCQKW